MMTTTEGTINATAVSASGTIATQTTQNNGAAGAQTTGSFLSNGGAATTGSQAPSTTTPVTGATGQATAVTFPENWKEGLADEFKNDPSINKYATIPDLIKGFANAQKMIGRDKITLPDSKFATADDWKGVFQKLGLPEKPESYEISLPKDVQFDPEFLKNFKSQAFQNNILPKQAESMLGWYAGLQLQAKQQDDSQKANARFQAQAELKREWGEAYTAKQLAAQSAARRFFSEAGIDVLESSGLADNVHIAKAFAAIGEILKEHGIKGNAAQFTGLTPEDASQKIKDVMANKDHPYWKKDHAGHRSAVEEMTRFFNAANPS